MTRNESLIYKAQVLINLGKAHVELGMHESAKECYDAARQALRDFGDDWAKE